MADMAMEAALCMDLTRVSSIIDKETLRFVECFEAILSGEATPAAGKALVVFGYARVNAPRVPKGWTVAADEEGTLMYFDEDGDAWHHPRGLGSSLPIPRGKGVLRYTNSTLSVEAAEGILQDMRKEGRVPRGDEDMLRPNTDATKRQCFHGPGPTDLVPEEMAMGLYTLACGGEGLQCLEAWESQEEEMMTEHIFMKMREYGCDYLVILECSDLACEDRDTVQTMDAIRVTTEGVAKDTTFHRFLKAIREEKPQNAGTALVVTAHSSLSAYLVERGEDVIACPAKKGIITYTKPGWTSHSTHIKSATEKIKRYKRIPKTVGPMSMLPNSGFTPNYVFCGDVSEKTMGLYKVICGQSCERVSHCGVPLEGWTSDENVTMEQLFDVINEPANGYDYVVAMGCKSTGSWSEDLEIDPNNSGAWLELAQAGGGDVQLCGANKTYTVEECIDQAEAALSRFPHSVVHAKLAMFFDRERADMDGAARHWGEAMRLEPYDPIPHQQYANTLWQSTKSDADCAEFHFKESLRLDPKRTDTYVHYAIFLHYSGKGHGHTIRELYREALRLDPNNSFAHDNKAFWLMDTEQWDEAEAHLKHAIDLDEYAYQDFGIFLIGVLFKLGRRAEAKARAVKVGPETINCFYDAHIHDDIFDVDSNFAQYCIVKLNDLKYKADKQCRCVVA